MASGQFYDQAYIDNLTETVLPGTYVPQVLAPALPSVVAGSTGAAAANTAAIAAALAAGAGEAYILGRGTIWVTSTLLIPSKTKVILGRKCTVELVPGAAAQPVWMNASAFAATAAVTSFTCLSFLPENGGTVGIVTVASHSLAVGDWVFTNGATTSGYNGVFRITATTPTTLTVQMPFKPGATTATGTIVFRKADTDIQIEGGTASQNGSNSTANNTYMDCASIFQGVANLTLRDVVFRDAVKYSVLLGGVTNYKGDNLRFENTISGSDGLHLGGSVFHARVDGMSGYTGDDFYSQTIGDYSQFEIVRGDIYDVKVTGTSCEWSPKNIFKICGSAPFFHKDITFDGVAGSAELLTLQVTDDTNLVGTQGSDIQLNRVAASTGGLIAFTPTGSFNSVTVDGVDLDMFDGCTKDIVTVGPTTGTQALFGRIALRGVRSVRSTMGTINLLRMNLATGSMIAVEDCDIKGSSTTGIIFQNAGTVAEVLVNKNRFTTFNEVYRQNSTAVGDGTVFTIAATVASGGTRISEFQSAGVVFVGEGVRVSSLASTPFKASAAGKTVLYDGASPTQGVGVDIGACAANVRIRGNMRCDFNATLSAAISAGNILQPGDGGYNSNTAWSGGTGVDKSGLYVFVSPTVAMKVAGPDGAFNDVMGWAIAQAFVVVAATRDGNEAITTATVQWPDGQAGTFTTDTASTAFPGAIDAYHVTYGSPTVHTYTQAAVTRDANGAVTAQPALAVS